MAAKSSSKKKTTNRTSQQSRATASRKTASKSTARKSSGKTKSAGNRASAKRSTATRSRSASPMMTDHEEIQSWAEERGGVPACVRGTGGKKDVGMIRIDFPDGPEPSLQEISWDEWFDKFDENDLALVYQDKTVRGQPSRFNKLVKRGAQGGSRRQRTAGA